MTAAGGGPPVPDDDPSDEAIADTAGELAQVLEELRDELRGSRRRGPFGLPAPPTPRELLRFTDDFAIPFAIAVLEANIRALRLLQGAIRLVDAGEQAREDARTTRDRAISLSQSTLGRLDDVLSDLEDAAVAESDEGEYPRNPEARSILQEARDLRRELTDALAEPSRSGDATSSAAETGSSDEEATIIPIRDESRARTPDGDDQSEESPGTPGASSGADEPEDEDENTEVNVDVEGELQSIREQLGKVDEEADAEVATDKNDAASSGTDDSSTVSDEGTPTDADPSASEQSDDDTDDR